MFFVELILQALMTVIVLVIVLFITVLIALKKIKGNDHVSLKKATKVVFDIKAVTDDVSGSYVSSDKIQHYDVMQALKHLATDKQIEEVIILVDELTLTSSQIDEYRPLFDEINKYKKVVAFGSTFDTKNYSAALLASRIYMLKSKSATLFFKGFSKQEAYLKRFLQKFGIRMNVLHVGSYKATGETFHLNHMSQEKKESLERLQNEQLHLLTKTIREKRQVDISDVLLNGELILADYAKAKMHRLVDDERLIHELNINYEKDTIRFSQYVSEYKHTKNKAKDKIAVIILEGTITSGDKGIHYQSVVDKLEQVKKMPSVKGIVLRINSPGGSALESEKIYQQLLTIDIPIYVSMGQVCASGGYYISTVAKKLYATPHTLTGSIGVVMMFPDMSQSLEKLDVSMETISQGVGHQLMDITKPLDEFSKEKILTSMEAVYSEFTQHVMTARQMSEEELEPLAQGRVWLGSQAKEIGLIDSVGSLNDCIEDMAKDLGLARHAVSVVYTSKSIKQSIASIKPSIITSEWFEIVQFIHEHKETVLCWEELPWHKN